MVKIAVAKNKFARGLPHKKGAPACYEVLDLYEAMNREWKTSDAHCVSYVVGDPDAPPAMQQRITKKAVEDGIASAWTTCFMVDVDNPGHSPWTDELLEKAHEQYRTLTILATCGVYHTAHGRRIVQPIRKPIPVQEVEPYLMRYLLQLTREGLAVDMTCKDWTRHFRMPHVARSGEFSRAPYISL
jgi:hypothetical protein